MQQLSFEFEKQGKTCAIAGCGNTSRGHLCRSHHYRLKRYGDPLGGRKIGSRHSAIDHMRFIEKVVANPPSECVTWPLGQSGGYGLVKFNDRQQTAHRVALMLATGKSENDAYGLLACHGPCHNRLCVNPRHLYFGTVQQNAIDRGRDGTQQRGQLVYSAKLTPAKVQSIRSDQRSDHVVAREFGVSVWTVHDVRQRKSWQWFTP